jgi:ribonuclease HI
MPKAIQSSWKPPPSDIYKINVDGAFHSDARAGGWGIVIRDKSGEVLAAGAGSIRYPTSAVQTEAIAAYKGLQLAAQLGMTNVILETDATLLATGLISEQMDMSPIGCIVRQSRFSCVLNFLPALSLSVLEVVIK